MAEPLRTWSHYGKRRTRRDSATFSENIFWLREGPFVCPQLDGTCAYNDPSGNGHDMEPEPGEITQLLQQWRTGDRQVEDRLFELLAPEMHQIAERCFRRERPGNSLQPTALVNEAFLRLAKSRDLDWQDRGHFLAISARVMRRYLIDHARARPDILFLSMEGLPERFLGTRCPSELVIAVDELLNDLEKESPSRRALVELKFFLGSTDQETADALGITLHTMQREWYRARRWLFERLTRES
jgi:RNA polymerase sigma factor (TIGR02999 family)